MRRIIDNKLIDLTDDEFQLYKDICKAYTKPNFDGKELFKNLFETDDSGRIIFLKPPTTYTSMEVFMFCLSVMIHQHLGHACGETFKLLDEGKKMIDELKILKEDLEKLKNDK